MRFIQLLIVSLYIMSAFVLAEDIDEDAPVSTTFNIFFEETFSMIQEGMKERLKNVKTSDEAKEIRLKYWEKLALECKNGDDSRCLPFAMYPLLLKDNAYISRRTGISQEIADECTIKGEEYIGQLCADSRNGNACFVFARGLEDGVIPLTEKFKPIDPIENEEKYIRKLVKMVYQRGCTYHNEESCLSSLRFFSSPKEALKGAHTICYTGNPSICRLLGRCFSEFGGVKGGFEACAIFGQKYPDYQKVIKYFQEATFLEDMHKERKTSREYPDDDALLVAARLEAKECENKEILKDLCEIKDNGIACFALARAYGRYSRCLPHDGGKANYYTNKACNTEYKPACDFIEEQKAFYEEHYEEKDL